MNIIVDTSAIVVLFEEDHPEHNAIANVIETSRAIFVVSPLVAAEVDYMLQSRLRAEAARDFATDIVTGAYELAEWTADHHAAALAVTTRFGDDKDYIGIADAGNVILADRYHTTEILTLDQRHFRRLRPLWGAEHFTLLPYDI